MTVTTVRGRVSRSETSTASRPLSPSNTQTGHSQSSVDTSAVTRALQVSSEAAITTVHARRISSDGTHISEHESAKQAVNDVAERIREDDLESEDAHANLTKEPLKNLIS